MQDRRQNNGKYKNERKNEKARMFMVFVFLSLA